MPGKSISDFQASVQHLVDALAASKLRWLAVMTRRRIRQWTRYRAIAIAVPLIAFAAFATNLVSSSIDLGAALFNRVLGWGSCFERDPSDERLTKRLRNRACNPGAITLFAWNEPPVPPSPPVSGLKLTGGRAMQFTGQRADGRGVWLEYYQVEEVASGNKTWKTAHGWTEVRDRVPRGDGSYQEGLVLQRYDDSLSVCVRGASVPTPLKLELMVPSDADEGCPSNIWGDPGSFGWRSAVFVKDHFRQKKCSAGTVPLFSRWRISETPGHLVRCSPDLGNKHLYREETKDLRWQAGPMVMIRNRD